jgi:hypothetical protein
METIDVQIVEEQLTANFPGGPIYITPKRFLELLDVNESSFTGHGGNMVRVKIDESGLEFGIGSYTLLPATSSVLGGVKIGTRLTIDINGVLSADPSMVYPAAGISVSTGAAWDTSISNNSFNWNTAYGWGNHAGLYRPIAWMPTYSDVGAAASGHNHTGLYLPVSSAGDIYTHNASEFVIGTPWTGMGYLTSLIGAVLTSQVTPQTIGDTTNRLSKLWATDMQVTNAIVGGVTGNAGTVTNGVYTTGAGSVYEVPLTFGSGLTRTVNAVVNDLITGKSGGQSIYGGLAQTEVLNIYGNIATASGTNIAGGDVYIKAVPGTGTGASSVHIFTGTTLTTGAVLQTSSEKVTILGNGNVGIGTTAPGYKLTVSGGDISLDDGKYIYSNSNALLTSYSGDTYVGSANNTIIRSGSGGNRIYIKSNGNVGIGPSAPTSLVDIKAGTASVAPFGLASGPVLTSPLVGKLEFLTDDLYFTISTGAARKQIVMTDGSNLTLGAIPKATTNGRLIDSPVVGIAHGTFKSPTTSNGIFHAFGFYEAPAAHAALTQASATQTLGSANNAYQSHAFIVASAAGTASDGTTGTAKITITGTSITSAGVRSAGDSEIIVADVTALATNTYIESTKMWIGQVTFTLATTGDRTTFACTFNYGFGSAYHFSEKNVTIQQFECTGRAGASDTGFNIQLLKHSNAGWTYSAAAFIPGGTVLLNMNTDFNTEKNLVNDKQFHYHRKGLTQAINGATTATLTVPNEGVVVRITTGANNAVDTCDMRIQYI